MKKKSITITLVMALLILSILSLFVGVIRLDFTSILQGDFEQIEILLISRLPRLLAILCTGMGMSAAGLIMQQLCMNKFVSPTTGATISCAQLGILVALIFFANSSLMEKTMFAFVFAILGTWIFVFFIQKIKFKDIIMVPLVGIMFGNIINGVINYFSFKYGLMQALSSWLVGDFSLIVRGRYEIVFLVIPLIIVAFIFANHFNIVGMGEDFSKNLGVHYNIVLLLGLSIAALITASVVVTVGSISYIGLIVPNIVSMFKGDKLRGSMLDTTLVGALFVLICDVVGRVINFPYELPIDLIVGVLGSIIFIGLLSRRLNSGNGKKIRLKPSGCGCGTLSAQEHGKGGA